MSLDTFQRQPVGYWLVERRVLEDAQWFNWSQSDVQQSTLPTLQIFYYFLKKAINVDKKKSLHSDMTIVFLQYFHKQPQCVKFVSRKAVGIFVQRRRRMLT